MPLSQAAMNCVFQWALTRSNSPYGSTTQGPDSQYFNVRVVPVATFEQMAAVSETITSGSFVDVDLTVQTNLVDEQFAFAHVLGMFATSDGAPVQIGPAPTSGWYGFWSTSGVNSFVDDDGFWATSANSTGSGLPVTAGQHKVRVSNTGTVSTTVDLVIFGGT